MFPSINYLFGRCIFKIMVMKVNTIWTKENGLSYLMRFWLVMESSLYFKVVLVVFYLKVFLVCSIILLAIFYVKPEKIRIF